MSESDTHSRGKLPGSLLLRIAERLCSRQAYDAVVVPTVADLQHEYASATDRRAWICLRGYIALLKALAVCFATWPVRHLRLAWLQPDAPGRQFFWRLLPRAGVPLAVLVLLSIVPTLRGSTLVTVVLGVPALIVGLTPMAMFIGVALTARRLFELRRAVLGPVIGLSLVLSLALFLCCGWIVPRATDAWRARQQSAQAGERRPAEERWTTPFSRLSVAELESRASGHDRQAARYRVEWHLTLAFPIGCCVLGILGLAAALLPRRPRPVLLTLASCPIFLVYYTLTRIGESLVLAGSLPGLAIWLANVTFLALALGLLAMGRRKAGTGQRPATAA